MKTSALNNLIKIADTSFDDYRMTPAEIERWRRWFFSPPIRSWSEKEREFEKAVRDEDMRRYRAWQEREQNTRTAMNSTIDDVLKSLQEKPVEPKVDFNLADTVHHTNANGVASASIPGSAIK